MVDVVLVVVCLDVHTAHGGFWIPTRPASLQAWRMFVRTVEWCHTSLNICSSALHAQHNWQLKTYGTIQTRWLIFLSSTTTNEGEELWATTTTTTITCTCLIYKTRTQTTSVVVVVVVVVIAVVVVVVVSSSCCSCILLFAGGRADAERAEQELELLRRVDSKQRQDSSLRHPAQVSDLFTLRVCRRLTRGKSE